MASLLDQLINEIAIITGLTVDDVKTNFTQEQLDNLLKASKCEDIDYVSPIIDDLDLPCEDLGVPADITDIKIDDIINTISEKDQEILLDGSECIESVDIVNQKVREAVDKHSEYNILLNRLYELQDNIEPIKFYYKERANRMALILGIFTPILTEIKRLDAEINKINKIDLPEIDKEVKLLTNINGTINAGNQERYDALQIRKNDLIKLLSDNNIELGIQKNLLSSESLAFPALNNPTITNYHYGGGSSSSLINSIGHIISNEMIGELNNSLSQYSEYIKLIVNNPDDNYSALTSSPLIRFRVNFQNLEYMMIDKERFSIQTGDKSVNKEKYLIRNNKLLQKNSFFNGVPGYDIENISEKRESEGAIYRRYYNKLNDPINELFSIDERGLTSSAGLLDPKLKGSSNTTKRENQKEYYIRDLSAMQEFYQNFDALFEQRKQQVRTQVKNDTIELSRDAFEQIARMDVDIMLAFGRVNMYLPEDNDITDTIINKITLANQAFIDLLTDLDSEISRIEIIVKESKPTPESVKELLKKENSKCFEKINEDPGGCPDVDAIRGSDPFFKSLGGADPTMPNFSQFCYWKEFTKLVNSQGLFPIPNNPSTLRYWPVGLIIPTPATIIKIPLPMIWIPLVVVATPLGVLVTFLNINGIFISPIVFFMSASGYKQHLITIKGSSKKFGSDEDTEHIKSNIQIPLNIAAGLDISKSGGSSDGLTEKEKARIKILEEKKRKSEEEGDTVRVHKANKEINGIKKQAADRKKPRTVKMKDAADSEENAIDMVAKIKKKIFKNMDDIGKPSPRRINKLKEKSIARENKLKAEKLEAMEAGDTERVKKINKKLKSDGLTIKEKKEAYTNDLLDYYNKIIFPSVTLPKQTDKINPKEKGTDASKDIAKEMASSNDIEFASNHSTKLKTIIGVNIAKHKDEIEKEGPDSELSIDNDDKKIRKSMKKMLNKVKDKSKGKGSKPIDSGEATAELIDADSNVEKQTDLTSKKKAKKDLQNKQKSLSDKLRDDKTKQLLSMTPAVIAGFAEVNVQIDPYAPCCPKDNLSIGYVIPLAIDIAIDQGISILADAIDNMSIDKMKSMFGGKKSISSRDMRLALHSLAHSVIPNSLSIPKPEINLKSATAMFSGILGGLAIPQVSLPPPLSTNQLGSKININLSIVKPIIENALIKYLNDNLLTKNSQSLDSSFMTSNPNDIKSFMKTFIDSMSDEITSVLSTYYSVINSPLIKNGNGLNLNSLESTVFNVPPFGPTAKSLFIAKGKRKLSLKKSSSQFIINEDALKIASGIMITTLSPIVSNPVAGLMVAGAGVTNSLDSIRKLHPILSADDIPPWERLTAKNILLLIFLDEFISTAADQVGFFRSYL